MWSREWTYLEISMIKAFLHYFWGIIFRPRGTLDELAAQSSVRWAVMAAAPFKTRQYFPARKYYYL